MKHNVILEAGGCHLYPTTHKDTDEILELWNAPHVVGKLFMSKTTRETYLKYFALYENDPSQYRWTVRNDKGAFIGTTGIKILSATRVEAGFYALWPTECFLSITPAILRMQFVFDILNADEEIGTTLAGNRKIEQLNNFIGVEYTGEETQKIGSNGQLIVLKHCRMTQGNWAKNKARLLELCS